MKYWVFWLGVWYGVRKSGGRDVDVEALEREVLQRLEVELDLVLAMPPAPMPPAGRGLKEGEQ